MKNIYILKTLKQFRFKNMLKTLVFEHGVERCIRRPGDMYSLAGRDEFIGRKRCSHWPGEMYSSPGRDVCTGRERCIHCKPPQPYEAWLQIGAELDQFSYIRMFYSFSLIARCAGRAGATPVLV